MPRALSGAGLPLQPEELPDWVFLIGHRPPGEHRAIDVWLAQEAPHLLRENGRPTRDFMAERRRRRWQECDGYGIGFYTRLYRPGNEARPGDDDNDQPTVPDPDPRRLLFTDEHTGPISGSDHPRARGARRR